MNVVDESPPVVLTMGEPAGIGGEIALKAWARLAERGPVFFAIDDSRRLARIARELGSAIETIPIADPTEAAMVFRRGLPVLETVGRIEAAPGRPAPSTAQAVIASIRQAVELVQGGAAAALCTNPIQKSALTGAGFGFPGHTEFLAHLSGGGRAIMMLAGPDLRVVPITIHVPLRAVPDLLTTDLVVETAVIASNALQSQFGILRPRLALAGSIRMPARTAPLGPRTAMFLHRPSRGFERPASTSPARIRRIPFSMRRRARSTMSRFAQPTTRR